MKTFALLTSVTAFAMSHEISSVKILQNKS